MSNSASLYLSLSVCVNLIHSVLETMWNVKWSKRIDETILCDQSLKFS